jgi:hypothetical protein
VGHIVSLLVSVLLLLLSPFVKGEWFVEMLMADGRQGLDTTQQRYKYDVALSKLTFF